MRNRAPATIACRIEGGDGIFLGGVISFWVGPVWGARSGVSCLLWSRATLGVVSHLLQVHRG